MNGFSCVYEVMSHWIRSEIRSELTGRPDTAYSEHDFVDPEWSLTTLRSLALIRMAFTFIAILAVLTVAVFVLSAFGYDRGEDIDDLEETSS